MSTEAGPPDEEGREHGHTGLARALLLTVASTIVPGTAHLSRGRRVIGSLLLGAFLALVAAGVALAVTSSREELIGLAVRPSWLLGITIGAAALALAWAAVVVSSYRAVRPAEMPASGRVLASVVVMALCLVVCAPMFLAANFAQAGRGLLTDLFPDTVVSSAPGGTDPWATGDRVNILLLGGDADPERPGVRTDVMMVASIDPDTGRTVLFSLPRNLQNAPMPFPLLRQRFPNGYPKFLFGVWRYGVQHPDLVPGRAKPGATLLTATIQGILGIPVHHYALVDLDGFKALVNALGGVWINVQEPIPYGEHGQFTVRAGYRKLNGRDALWYARSRTGTSDYDRMRRQRCMIGALAQQADPVTVLRNFRDLASATKRTVSTNVPQDLLPHLIDLAPKVKDAKITNFQFVPPKITTGDPNFRKIRRITQRVIDNAEHPHRDKPVPPKDTARPPDATPSRHIGEPTPIPVPPSPLPGERLRPSERPQPGQPARPSEKPGPVERAAPDNPVPADGRAGPGEQVGPGQQQPDPGVTGPGGRRPGQRTVGPPQPGQSPAADSEAVSLSAACPSL